MRLTLLLQSVCVLGQRGQGFGFKKNRLVRMFESEINWLDTYFGSNAVTTEEYVQHDNRIRRNWAGKLGRNKDRLIKRLHKCGGLLGEDVKVEESQGGFTDYDEEKKKELEKQQEDDKPKDEIQSLSTEELAAGNNGSKKNPLGRGRGRRSIENFVFSEDEMTSIGGLDFSLKDESSLDGEEAVVSVSPISNLIQARSRGQRQQAQRQKKFDAKKSVAEIRNILQGFAIWAKNHISKCEPNQPQKQMARASKWFKVLGKKVVVKSMHLGQARRDGIPLLNT